jgi:phosphoglycerate kinase
MKLIQKDLTDLDQKILLLRLDLNVPIRNEKIQDFNRIDKILPTIKFLLKRKAKIILISHVGRPMGKKDSKFSLKPISKSLSAKLSENVRLIDQDIFEIKKNDIFKKNEKIVMLENIRFYKEEEQNDLVFSKKLASLGDLYVNEAFSCSHRNHASVSQITKHIDSYAGINLALELEALKKITSEITKPTTCLIGGSKISTKIKIIRNLITKFDNIIIVGAMANNIIKFKGHEIGKSLCEKNCDEIIEEIFTLGKENNCNIVFPEDVSVGKNFEDSSQNKDVNKIAKDDLILDIGSKTIIKIVNLIKNSKTILWNGPAGYFENDNFATGSFELAKEISAQTKSGNIFSVIGGGDTVSVINKLKLFNDFNFVSTAGGAFLEYLEGKDLPGIKSLNYNE